MRISEVLKEYNISENVLKNAFPEDVELIDALVATETPSAEAQEVEEKLVDKYSHLNNAEILQIQLSEFEKWLELAQLNHLPSMIFIHGVGKGKLKQEIHDLLKVKSGIKSFVNQYNEFYGYGATEVFFS